MSALEQNMERVLRAIPAGGALDNRQLRDALPMSCEAIKRALLELRRRNMLVSVSGGERGRKLWRRVE